MVLWVPQTKSGTVWEETTQARENQGVGVLGGHFGAAYHSNNEITIILVYHENHF